MALWTIIRSITNGVNFDVVGQIGVAEQWARGMHSGAEFGATNYVLKLPLYFIVNGLDFLGPHAALLLLALLCNIATFVGIAVVIRRLLGLYNIRLTNWFYIGMVWLASISERVFWLDYANSRNLEVVGGLFVLYFGLKLYKQPSLRGILLLSAIGGVAFFADQLQLYVIGGGLIIGALLLALIARAKVQLIKLAHVVVGIIGAAIIAKLLLLIVTKIVPISFLVAPTGNTFDTSTITASLRGSLTSTLRIFDVDFYAAGSLINAGRQGINLLLFVVLVAIVVFAWRKASPACRELGIMLLSCIAAAYGAYLASGQAALPQTERYLIMVPILFVALLATLSGSSIISRRISQSCALLIITVSFLLASGALAINLPNRYDKDVNITQTLAYLQQRGYRYALGSRDGIPMTYFSSFSKNPITVAPLICQPGERLVTSNLFFDKAGFARPQITQEVPLLVPVGGFVSSGSVCNEAAVLKQFGRPVRIEPINSGSNAYIYSPLNL